MLLADILITVYRTNQTVMQVHMGVVAIKHTAVSLIFHQDFQEWLRVLVPAYAILLLEAAQEQLE
jgi:hypothetical protein